MAQGESYWLNYRFDFWRTYCPALLEMYVIPLNTKSSNETTLF